jgi:uncharacterized protein YqjF (DUF2071 family)
MLEQGKFLTADWRYLAMLNYEIDPGVLLPYVPPGTELDSWGNKTLVSMVGFLFLNTRIFGVPIPFHTNFEEVNLRFYVRRQSPEGYRRGVVFIKEIVPKIAIAKIARAIYNENYIAIPMRHSVQQPDSEAETSLLVEYGWRFDESWNSLRVEAQGQAQPIPADSEEEFITEHYWGYSLQKDNGCVEYQVEHPRWRVWRVNDCALECDVAALYGQPFVEYLQARPSSAFLAEGSSVLVRHGARLSTGIDDHE